MHVQTISSAPALCLARNEVSGFREMAAGALDGPGRGDYIMRFGAGGPTPPEITVADVSPWLLEMLVCPLSKARVVRVGDWLYSTDPQTRRRYPIRHGIPNMLVEESEVVDPREFERILAACASQEQQRHP